MLGLYGWDVGKVWLLLGLGISALTIVMLFVGVFLLFYYEELQINDIAALFAYRCGVDVSTNSENLHDISISAFSGQQNPCGIPVSDSSGQQNPCDIPISAFSGQQNPCGIPISDFSR